MPSSIGSGGAVFDYDGDGDLDLYLVGGMPATESELADRLLRQDQEGQWHDVTEFSGLGHNEFGMGAAVGDYDADGDLDLFVTTIARDVLYENRGDGSFRDVTDLLGGMVEEWSTSACFVDFDGDSDLDLYVGAYVVPQPPKTCRTMAGAPEFCGPLAYRATPDRLYVQEDERFEERGAQLGLTRANRRALGVACLDVDRDGLADIYVANDGEDNTSWQLQEDGTLADRAVVLGSARNAMGEAEGSMGLAVGDVDGDGRIDLLSTHLNRESNTLYLQNDAGFADATGSWRLMQPTLGLTGFGAAFFDFELDGDLDLVVANGKVRRINSGDAPPSDPGAFDEFFLEHYAEPAQLFLNQVEGSDGDRYFSDASQQVGFLDVPPLVGRGLAVADIDSDGLQDVVITHANAPPRLWLNRTQPAGRWLTLTDEEGEFVSVRVGQQRWTQPHLSASSYLFGSGGTVHFGLGEVTSVDSVTVQRRDGSRLRLSEMPTNRRLLLRTAP